MPHVDLSGYMGKSPFPLAIPVYFLTEWPAEELHVGNVTSSSLVLRWTGPHADKQGEFHVIVTRLLDHTLVLRENLTGTELLLTGLESAQKYHVVVTTNTHGQAGAVYKGIVSTSEFVQY